MALLVQAVETVGAPSGARPNLVFVFSDQQSWDMLGCYGNRDVRSPNIDRLSRQGVLFNHCVSNSPVCTPFRGILLSGQHPLHNGAFQNDIQMLPGRGNYLAEVLRDAGYRTGYFGKWHLHGGDRDRGVPPGPLRYGFDHEFLTNNCTLVYDADRAWYWDQDGRTRRLYGDWEPYAQTRQAMDFVDRHADKPFALFLSWHPPHNWGAAHEGYAAPADLLALYDPDKLTLRPTVKDTPGVRRGYQGHMAMITSIDRAFGWLMQKLEDKGLSENTIVVFTSDHGDTLWSYDWPYNKGIAQHLSSRVPLLIRWPGCLRSGVSELLIGTFDLMPTLLGFLGLAVPETCQGRDASSAIRDGRQKDEVDAQPLYWLPGNWRGVYTRRYTYSESLVEGKPERNVLYDRLADPWEIHNRFDDPAFAGVRGDLHARTRDFMRHFGDLGLQSEEVLRRVIRDEDLPNVFGPAGRRPDGWEARLKGRPVDILASVDAT